MKTLSLVPVVISLAIGSAPACLGATLHVINTSDSGNGSLRQQIANAISGDEVVFDAGVTSRILLSTQLTISNKAITVRGPGANVLSLDGGAAARVLSILGTSAPVRISGLTITNGAVNGNGAGILNSGFLMLSDCSIRGNRTLGANLGGGICTSTNSTLGVTRCLLAGNQATFGGGLFNDLAANVSLTNCTLTGNAAAGEGGGIMSDGDFTAISCTIANNSCTNFAGGGVHMAGGYAFMGNCVVAGNMDLRGSPDVNLTFYSLKYNFVGITNGSVWAGGNDAFDRRGSSSSPLNPLLSSLAPNGGPTPTMPPLSGSPLIDKGHSFGLNTDQRGRARPFDNPGIANAWGGDGSDIGAVEISPATLVVTSRNDGGPGSLREAMQTGDAGDRITFAISGMIVLTNGELTIQRDLTIEGPGADVLAISGNKRSRIFNVLVGNNSISGISIQDGRLAGSIGFFEQNGENVRGGGLMNEATLMLTRCIISNNVAMGGQGGEGNFAGNGGNAFGGGLANIGTLGLMECTIVSNSAVGGLGGPATPGGFEGMGGQGYGGGFYNANTGTVTRCTVSGNTASAGTGGGGVGTGAGGGIYTEQSLALFTSTVAANAASGSPFDLGGGVYDQGLSLLIRNSTIASNSAGFGGGLYSSAADLGNTILAGNRGGSGAPDCSGGFVSSDYNLVQDTSGCTIMGTTTHNLTGQNPLLGRLRDNGGPVWTMELLQSSPAIDKGKRFGLTTDQRGYPRAFDFPSIPNASGGDGADIGAFEIEPRVNIAPSGSNVLLSWPTNLGAFVLQMNSNIANSNGWSAAASASIAGDQFVVAAPVMSGNRFYRIRR
jgi:hypothetical protein